MICSFHKKYLEVLIAIFLLVDFILLIIKFFAKLDIKVIKTIKKKMRLTYKEFY